MGGKEGAWGYLSQAVVAVINSLSDNTWTHVQIEPDTNNDKVDIAWFRDGENLEAVQVKSSKNNFPLPDVLSWIETLINDVSNASLYRLILIGTCSDTTKKAFNRINENKATTEDWKGNSFLEGFTERIKIQLENNDHEALESKIMRYLGQFLAKNQKHPSHFNLELMANALGYQFMRFSTNGEKISREEFEQQLLEWVEFNHMIEGRVRKSDLRIEFYLSQTIPFSTRMNAMHYELVHSIFIQNRKKEAMELLEEINQIKIPLKEREEQKEVEVLGRLLSISKLTYSEFIGKRKEDLVRSAEKILGVQLSDDFFYVGNLQEPVVKINGLFGSSPVQRTGDELEKEKLNLIIRFEQELEDLDSFLKTFSYLDSFHYVPLVIRNTGTKYDEKIRVKILVPPDISFMNADTLEYPDNLIIEQFTGFDGILHEVLSHEKDSIIQEHRYHPMPPSFHTAFLDNEKRLELKVDEFRYYLNRLFDFEVHKEGENMAYIFYFDEINPKESLAFPCFLLTRAQKSFTMKYEITSKNLTDISTGELHYQITD